MRRRNGPETTSPRRGRRVHGDVARLCPDGQRRGRNDRRPPLRTDYRGGLSGAVAISAGIQFSCALLGDGTVHCWGENDGGGQLGNGSLSAIVPTPVTVVNGS
ncbi:MAG TPA: RCC1 domain-containing protein [Polyangia bacterium]|nr:RCC1 domain-containing protein [Polyangia bacterium]